MEKIIAAYIRTQFWFGLMSGGSVGHTIGILNGFDKSGIFVKVLSNDSFFGINNFEHEIIEPAIKSPLWLGELLYNFLKKSAFQKLLLKIAPDFIYHRYTGYTFFVTLLARTLKIPIILEFNSFDTWKLKYWEKSKKPLKSLFQKAILLPLVNKIETYNLFASDLIVTVSDALEKSLLEAGIPKEKILVNTNGFNSDKFRRGLLDASATGALKSKLGIDKKKVVVGFCGTFGPWHGIPQLTEAIYNIISNKMSGNMHFLIIGDGGMLKTRMVEKLSAYSEVTFIGTVPYSEIQYYLSICDILLSPHNPPVDNKEFFGSPTKLFEYMAVGKGIIASNLGQIGKVLKNGHTAILVNPGDSGILADNIIKLAANKELREEMGKNASEEAFEKYTWEKNVERLLSKMKERSLI